MNLSVAAEFSREYGVLIIVSMLVSVIPHEGAHWAAARLFTADLSIERDKYEPNVQLHSPYDVPKWAIRVFGAMPAFIGTAGALGVVLLTPFPGVYSSWSIFWFTLFATMALGSVLSGGDWLAIAAPGEFQKFAAESTYETPSPKEAISLILN